MSVDAVRGYQRAFDREPFAFDPREALIDKVTTGFEEKGLDWIHKTLAALPDYEQRVKHEAGLFSYLETHMLDLVTKLEEEGMAFDEAEKGLLKDPKFPSYMMTFLNGDAYMLGDLGYHVFGSKR